MPQPKNNTPDAAPAALEKGQFNPYLQGLINEGEATDEAIKGWYAQRDALRQQARLAVSTGFCTQEQADAVTKLWPMPKRKKKDGAEESTDTPAAA